MSKQSHRGARTALKVTGALISAGCILASAVAIGIIAPHIPYDTARAKSNEYEVATAQSLLVCPAAITLADSEQYGDQEFQADAGNMSSQGTFTGFGRIFKPQLASLANAQSGENVATSENNNSLWLSEQETNETKLFSALMLDSQDGTGIASTAVSQASDGDLRGLAASSCVRPALGQRLLLPSTQVGTSHRLTITNPSDRATSVTLSLWSTASNQKIVAATGNTLSVGAYSQASIDIAAAVPDAQAVFVELSSTQAAVAASVQTTRMEGLTAHGIEYAPVLDSGSNQLWFALDGEQKYEMLLFSHHNDTAHITWDEDNKQQSKDVSIPANQVVSVSDLSLPKSATHIEVQAKKEIFALLSYDVSGQNGQQDIAYIAPGVKAVQHAVNFVQNTSNDIYVFNTAEQSQNVTITYFDNKGDELNEVNEQLASQQVWHINSSDIPQQAVTCIVAGSEQAGLIVQSKISSDALNKANVAGTSFINAQALTTVSSRVTSVQDHRIVQ